jgi:hypothetical protein
MSVTVNLPEEGSTLAFAYRDPQPGLASPQRPVWVLEEGYPKLAGTVGRGGAATANRRTLRTHSTRRVNRPKASSRRSSLRGRS